MVSVNSTGLSLLLANNVKEAGNNLGTALERISSGLRINRSSDDPAGSQLATKLNADVRQYTAAIQNGNQAISSLQIADAGLSELTQILSQIEEIIGLAGNSSLTSSELASLQTQSDELVEEYNRIISTTEYNSQGSFDANQSLTSISLGGGSTVSYTQGDALERTAGTAAFLDDGTIESGDLDFATLQANQDGFTDLVYINGGSEDVHVATNNGDGTFTTSDAFYTIGYTVGAIATGDFNNDGFEDFIVGAAVGSGANQVEIYINDGDGNFTGQGTMDIGRDVAQLETADLNNDGNLDVFLIGSTGLTFYLEGDGGGALVGPTATSIGETPSAIGIGDFNGDGTADIVVGSSDDSSGIIYIGDGNFGYTAVDNFTFGGSSLTSFSIDDVNFDGIDDIATSDGGNTGGVVILNSSGTVESQTTISALDYHATFGDFNSDGNFDVGGLTTDGSFQVFLGDGEGNFTADNSSSLNAGNTTYELAVDDFDRDGAVDILQGQTDASNIQLFKNVTQNQTDLKRLDLQTAEGRAESQSIIDDTQTKVANEQALVGAHLSRFEFAISNLSNIRTETSAGRDRILNADLATETANLVRSEILRDSATAAFAQFNQNADSVLVLLGGSIQGISLLSKST